MHPLTRRIKLAFWRWSTQFDYFNTRVHFPRGSILYRMALEQGVYEREVVRVLRHFIRPSAWHFDVGANIGLMAVPLLSHESTLRVVSYEPSPNSVPFLRRNVTESSYSDRWKLVESAIGSRIGEVTFTIHSRDMGALDGLKDTARVGGASQIKVPLTTLDHEWNELGKPVVGTIKIDVEGNELEVLMGSTALISGQRPTIVLEWNAENFKNYGVAPDALLNWAREAGYHVFSLPDCLPINSVSLLRLKMVYQENYILLPSEKHLG